MSLRFTKDHEWIRAEGDFHVVGISDYAQQQLGDVVYVELPMIGRQVAKGEQVAVVESVKAASEIYSPATGTIAAVNERLTAEPALVNGAPTGDGWFFKLSGVNPAALSELMDEAAYEAFTKDQH